MLVKFLDRTFNKANPKITLVIDGEIFYGKHGRLSVVFGVLHSIEVFYGTLKEPEAENYLDLLKSKNTMKVAISLASQIEMTDNEIKTVCEYISEWASKKKYKENSKKIRDFFKSKKIKTNGCSQILSCVYLTFKNKRLKIYFFERELDFYEENNFQCFYIENLKVGAYCKDKDEEQKKILQDFFETLNITTTTIKKSDNVS